MMVSSFITNYLLSTYHTSGSLLESRDMIVNKTDKNVCSHKAYDQVQETDNKPYVKCVACYETEECLVYSRNIEVEHEWNPVRGSWRRSCGTW